MISVAASWLLKRTKVHFEIAQEGLLGCDMVLGSALVDMYAKCGSLAKEQEVFDLLLVQDSDS